MIAFDAAHQAVHYPPGSAFSGLDQTRLRRRCLRSRVTGVWLLAWGQAGLSSDCQHIPSRPQLDESSASGPHGAFRSGYVTVTSLILFS